LTSGASGRIVAVILCDAKSIAGLILMVAVAVSAVASSPEQVALGRALFQDPNLSNDRSVSCASCHARNRAFSDGKTVSVGTFHRRGTRNAPSLIGLSEYPNLFWDGRADSLEEQAAFPLYSATEMGLSGPDQLLTRVGENPEYLAQSQAAKGRGRAVAESDIIAAIVAYERSLVRDATPFDRYLAGDEGALSANAKEGLTLFRGRAGCSSCHLLGDRAAPLTDGAFHESAVSLRAAGGGFAAVAIRVTGLPIKQRLGLVSTDARVAALGRFVITLDPKDIGCFRTPSLRNAGLTAPYMHDGSVPTLQAAIDLELYYRGLKQGYPVNFSLEERRDLRLFIESVTGPPVRKRRASSDGRTALRQSRPLLTVSTKHE
jgi:cytochrome c peroxidase